MEMQTKSLYRKIFYEAFHCIEKIIIQDIKDKYFIKSYGADTDRQKHLEIESTFRCHKIWTVITQWVINTIPTTSNYLLKLSNINL